MTNERKRCRDALPLQNLQEKNRRLLKGEGEKGIKILHIKRCASTLRRGVKAGRRDEEENGRRKAVISSKDKTYPYRVNGKRKFD